MHSFININIMYRHELKKKITKSLNRQTYPPIRMHDLKREWSRDMYNAI